MFYKRLGASSLLVSELGFGGIPIMSGNRSHFLVSLKGINETDAIETVRRAYEKGVIFFDSATDYGDSEEKIGMALSNVRKNVVLASKSKALTYDRMKLDVEESLKRFRTSFIDLYQLHYVKNRDSYERIMNPNGGAYKALLEFKERSIIREIGIASHNPFVLKPAITSGYFATVQFPLNLLEQDCIEIKKIADDSGVGTIIMKPFAGGTLTKSSDKIKDLGLGDNKVRSLALKYVLQQNVDSVIPGMASISELDENLVIYNDRNLSEKDEKLIKELNRRLGKVFCRRCQYCEPCPSGLEIATTLRLVKYYEDYSLRDWAKEQYGKLEVKADQCMECGLCESKCPYGINIISELKRVHKILGEEK